MSITSLSVFFVVASIATGLFMAFFPWVCVEIERVVHQELKWKRAEVSEAVENVRMRIAGLLVVAVASAGLWGLSRLYDVTRF